MATYVYKLVADDGGAPCVSNGLLSLAICKPQIRRSAPVGSWIFEFAANSLKKTHPDNRLIYVARVDERVPGENYYADKSPYRERLDCIYRPVHNGYEWRRGAKYHVEGHSMDHDLGTKFTDFDRAWVLVSREFRYFGKDGDGLRPTDPALLELMARLTQGHRCRLDQTTLTALDGLKQTAFKHEGLKASPIPREADAGCSGACERGLASDDPSCV